MVHKIKTQVFLKIFSVFLFVLLLGAYASTFALFNGNPYAPGSTLDPECAPTDTNCKVLLTSGGSSPWLTGTSNIYHNGNVNVGSDTASINTSIGGGSGLQNILTQNLFISNIPNYAIAMELNNGNPVMAWYSTTDAFYGGGIEFNFISKAYASTTGVTLIICSDPECSEVTDVNFDSDYQSQGQAPVVKIGSDGFIRMAYLGINQSVMYVKCNDTTCSSPWITQVGEFEGEYNIKMSLSLDNNDNPYIISSSNDGNGTWPYLFRYVESEDSWTGTYISNSLGLGIGSLSYGDVSGVGDYSYIDNDGHLNFVGAIPFGDYNNLLSLYTCNDVDCTSYTTSPIDQSYIFNSFLGKDSEGNPIVAYALGDNSTGQIFIKIATYVGDGTGTGCDNNINDEENYSSNWSCQTLKEYSNSKQVKIFDLEIGSDDNARVTYSVYERNNAPYYNTAILTKCLNTTCSSSEDTEIYNIDETGGDYYTSSLSIALDSNDMAYLAYGYLNQDFDSYSLKIDKENIFESVGFNPNGNDLFTFGDVGIKNNLFVDGSIVTPNGIYLNNGTPDNTFNALYNVGGDLYWNGSAIGGGSVSVGPDLILGTERSVSGSLNIASRYGGSTTLINYLDSCRSNYDMECEPIPLNNTLYLPSSSGILATEEYVYDSISNIPSSDSPIEIVNSSNLFSTGLGYSGSGVTAVTNSNFFGEYAGSVAINASYSNFLGYFAGYNAPSASYSNFLGHNAGYSATSASGSNFFGNSAGDSASSASNSNFFGTASGSGATNASYSNFFGFNAGNSASSASHSNFLGRNAGYLATNASYSNFFGYNAGQSASSASNSNFLGAVAGQSATNASNSNFLGVNAGQSATNASNSNFFGINAGSHSPNAANSIFIGRDSGINSSINNTDTYNDLTTFANTSILIGHKTSTGNYSNSIAIGAYATNTATNQFMIGSTTRPINTTRFQGATTECTISTGTGIACTSDERLKTITSDLNIDPITKEEISVLDKLIKVKTVNFKWNDNPEGKNNIGFLAQDLYNYFPELINGDPENKEEYLSVYYSNMTPILVEAIREMNLKVGNLDIEIKKITINDLMSDFFGGAVDQVVEGVAYLKDIVVGTLKVGSPEKRTGITLYDEETGDTYCLSISNGETKTTEGDCPVIKVPDACLNLEEYQSEIPSGYVLDENNDCVEEIKEVNNSLPLMPAGEVKPFSTETPASI